MRPLLLLLGFGLLVLVSSLVASSQKAKLHGDAAIIIVTLPEADVELITNWLTKNQAESQPKSIRWKLLRLPEGNVNNWRELLIKWSSLYRVSAIISDWDNITWSNLEATTANFPFPVIAFNYVGGHSGKIVNLKWPDDWEAKNWKDKEQKDFLAKLPAKPRQLLLRMDLLQGAMRDTKSLYATKIWDTLAPATSQESKATPKKLTSDFGFRWVNSRDGWSPEFEE